MQRHCNYIPLCCILIIKAAIQKDLIEYYRLMNGRYDVVFNVLFWFSALCHAKHYAVPLVVRTLSTCLANTHTHTPTIIYIHMYTHTCVHNSTLSWCAPLLALILITGIHKIHEIMLYDAHYRRCYCTLLLTFANVCAAIKCILSCKIC